MAWEIINDVTVNVDRINAFQIVFVSNDQYRLQALFSDFFTIYEGGYSICVEIRDRILKEQVVRANGRNYNLPSIPNLDEE